MSLPIPPDLWQHLCAFLAAHETCQVVIHQHQGRVCKLDLGLVKETVKAGQGQGIDKNSRSCTLMTTTAG